MFTPAELREYWQCRPGRGRPQHGMRMRVQVLSLERNCMERHSRTPPHSTPRGPAQFSTDAVFGLEVPIPRKLTGRLRGRLFCKSSTLQGLSSYMSMHSMYYVWQQRATVQPFHAHSGIHDCQVTYGWIAIRLRKGCLITDPR